MKMLPAYFAEKSAQTFDEAKKMFNEAYALFLINNSTYGKMAEVIGAQREYLALEGTSFEEYMSLQSGHNK